MKTTLNYGLLKPESMDFYDVDKFNDNMDIIDEELKELNELSTETARRFLMEAVNVYVSNDGNDITGDGSQEKPWKTIQHAVDMCPMVTKLGYTINLTQGSYDERVTIINHFSNIHILGADSLDDANNYIVKSIECYRCKQVYVKGLKLIGSIIQDDITGFYASITDCANLQYCKLVGCNVAALANATINIYITDVSDYIGSYSAINAIGGNIKCSTVTGSGNKIVYGAGINNGYGGHVYVSPSCTITGDTLIKEQFSGRVYYGTSGWQLIGTVTGNNDVNINTALYTEFMVRVRCANAGIASTQIFSSELSSSIIYYPGGVYSASTNYTYFTLSATKSAIALVTAVNNGSNVLASSSMSVYGRR